MVTRTHHLNYVAFATFQHLRHASPCQLCMHSSSFSCSISVAVLHTSLHTCTWRRCRCPTRTASPSPFWWPAPATGPVGRVGGHVGRVAHARGMEWGTSVRGSSSVPPSSANPQQSTQHNLLYNTHTCFLFLQHTHAHPPHAQALTSGRVVFWKCATWPASAAALAAARSLAA